jgi:aspartate kinase
MEETSGRSKNPLLIMKFGGTSVGSVEAMRQAVRNVLDARQDWADMIVVTSALSGVTNLLIDSAVRAAHGDMSTFHQAVSDLTGRHNVLIEQFVSNSARKHQVHWEVKHLIADFSNLCQSINVLGEASPRALDAVAALGERLSVRILAAAVESAGLPAEYIESTHLIVTDDHFQNALPDMAATTDRARQALLPMLAAGRVPVVTGFIGATQNGATTTLGRGGSDYSASILALALDAGEVWIWTDVDGVMTADPRMVPDARTIPVLSYREVAEMAHFGAKVLHPKSIHPVIEAGIGLRVCNTFTPTGPDTRLVADRCADRNGLIRAIATIRDLQLVTLAGRGMLGVPGVAGRIFSAVATTGISVPLIIESTSEQAICFPAPKEVVSTVIKTVRSHLSSDFQRGDIESVVASDDVDIITVVCPGLRTTPGVAGKIFGVLGSAGINVLGISFGASDVSINLIVSATDTQPAVLALHTLVD